MPKQQRHKKLAPGAVTQRTIKARQEEGTRWDTVDEIRVEIGDVLSEEKEEQGHKKYALQRAVQRGMIVPPYHTIQGILAANKDYRFSTLLALMHKLGISLRLYRGTKEIYRSPTTPSSE